MSKRLILFDIDGTLMTSAGVGRTALKRAVARIAGNESLAEGVVLSGRVDWAIWRDILALDGYSPDEVDAQLEDYFRLYVAELVYVLADPTLPKPKLLPGVSTLLAALANRRDTYLGLVTGNVEAAAWLKLGSVGIADYFGSGAFGSEAHERGALPPMALERASQAAGGYRFDPHEVVLIGDTAHDVACAESIGARTIAVATGTDSADTLRAVGADVVVATLEDTDFLLRFIDGE